MRLAMLSGVLCSTGCSFLFEVSGSNQCSAHSDCAGSGQARVCQEGLCILNSNANTGGDATLTDAGPSGCTSNAQCIDENANQPFVCQAGTCTDVRGPGCIVLDDDQLSNLRSESPIVIGAYTAMPDLNRARHQITLNYQMAVDEFHSATLGIPSAGARHKIVPVACDAQDAENFEASLDHLIDTLNVPGIVAPLYAAQLQQAFETKGLPNDVFFLSPWEADGQLAALQDNGLLWHILGSTTELAKSYEPLLARIESYLRLLDPSLPASLRIAWVKNDQRFMQELSRSAEGPIIESKGSDFLLRTISSDITAPGTDHTADIEAIVEFQPHIIVSLAGSEFVTEQQGGVMRGIETTWPSEVTKPFYLLSPWHAENQDLYNYVVSNSSIADRMVGINFSLPEDTRVLNTYQPRFSEIWENAAEAVGFENYYDAMYFMIYAIAASRSAPELTGTDLARGMKLLVNTDSGQSYDIFSGSQILSALNTSAQGIAVHGTMGAPNFNVSFGERLTPGGVYCVENSGEFFADSLRYKEGVLTGNLPCISDF